MDSPEQDHPNVIAMPPLIFAACLGVGLGLHYLAPFSFLKIVPRRDVATLLVAASAIIATTAGAMMHKAGTNVSPHKPATAVVTAGPYRFTRNPMYLSLCLLNAGIALFVGGLIPLLMTAVLATILHFGVILREEKYLAAKFGPAYVDYCTRVRRWL